MESLQKQLVKKNYVILNITLNGARPKWQGTKWYGQNGTDKMVWTKWYEDKIVQNSHLTAQLALICQDFH